MFLKSLSLKGFKSFADPTVMHLEPGVSVVVGPNGSGKSNVVDAIAWVLGAQAPSSVRSQKMDDVIFAGTASRPALGRAEVSLTIDNSARLLDIEFTEITVSRILFRTGDSEYAINGVPCRLLDVQELLSDAGVGRQQHVIVSQGQIDAVLNARPEDRRAIIEEAAGVLKFRKRKEKAERRLAATEASMLRLTDLLREVRRQLKPLERQADAARRHGDLVDELSALRIHVAGRQVAGLRAALANNALARHDHDRDEQAERATLARLDAEVLTLEAELSIRNASDVNDRLMRVDQLRERTRSVLALVAERRRSIARDTSRGLDADLVASLEHEVAAAQSEATAVAERLDLLDPERDQLTHDEVAFGDERKGVMSLFGTDPSTAASTAAAELRGELRSLRAGVSRTEADHQRAAQRHDQLARRVVELRVEIERRSVGLEQSDNDLVALESALDDAGSGLAAAELEEAECAARRDAAATATSHWSSRVEALQMALDAAHARQGATSLGGADGVVGMLLDLVEIDQGWEAAAQAALGEAFEATVFDGIDAARAAVGTLHAAATGASVVVLDNRSVPADRAPVDVTVDVGEPVRPHVRPRATVPSQHAVGLLLDRLLAGAVRVADADEALAVAVDHPDATIVTPEGDRFDRIAWRVGIGGDGGATAAALEEARTAAAGAASALVEARAGSEAALGLLDGAREVQRRAQKAVDDNRTQSSAAADTIDRARRQLHDVDTELESLAPEIGEQESHIASERARVEELERLVTTLEADEQAEASAARERSERIAALDARAAMLASRRRDIEVRRASLLERSELLTQRVEDIERRLDEDRAARAAAGERRLQHERTMEVLDRLHTDLDVHRGALESAHASLSTKRKLISDQVRGHVERLELARAERIDAEHRLETLRERSRRTEIEEAESRMRLESLVETLRRDLDVEPDVAEAAPRPELPDGVTPAAKVRELERELRLLGPINPLALEEFTELRERHSFLEGQLDDVRSTRRDLNRVISAVDQEIESVFSAAYTDVSAHFSTLFSMLFPGGVGRLVLTQPDDMLDTGIEVEAKPSGKNVKKLSLLSGGERSLTALAFLFAVFRSRPSPFYVMDEVEAALDDVNLHRFLGLLREFRQEAQLIVVSHQKRTMEAADVLLGVSMQPGGSSKVVAEHITSPEVDDPEAVYASGLS
ncbi:MAG: chromosome segregation protein SMC [Actinomycetota bacterium]|nr:chromosome segregation protein SMC [Actinomycetota bacterium]